MNLTSHNQLNTNRINLNLLNSSHRNMSHQSTITNTRKRHMSILSSISISPVTMTLANTKLTMNPPTLQATDSSSLKQRVQFRTMKTTCDK